MSTMLNVGYAAGSRTASFNVVALPRFTTLQERAEYVEGFAAGLIDEQEERASLINASDMSWMDEDPGF